MVRRIHRGQGRSHPPCMRKAMTMHFVPTPIATQPHSARLRLGRVSMQGQAYLLTTVTRDRAPVFADFTLARAAIAAMRSCDDLGESQTLAFVLMPDHLHWLMVLRAPTLEAVVRRFKSASARTVNQMRRAQGQALWQIGFHDHALRAEEDLRDAARYLVGNPVRAGLVDSVMDYSHWDAVWL